MSDIFLYLKNWVGFKKPGASIFAFTLRNLGVVTPPLIGETVWPMAAGPFQPGLEDFPQPSHAKCSPADIGQLPHHLTTHRVDDFLNVLGRCLVSQRELNFDHPVKPANLVKMPYSAWAEMARRAAGLNPGRITPPLAKTHSASFFSRTFLTLTQVSGYYTLYKEKASGRFVLPTRSGRGFRCLTCGDHTRRTGS